MTPEKYKELSIKEFTQAAKIYDSGHAGIYEMCKDDYPPILEELEKEKKARLLVTDVNADIYCKGRVLYASEGAARKEDGSFSAEGTEALYLLIK